MVAARTHFLGGTSAFAVMDEVLRISCIKKGAVVGCTFCVYFFF